MTVRRAAPALRGILGLLLLATAGAKLLDLRGFARVLGTYEVFRPAALLPVGVAVTLAELGLGAWLLWGRAPAAAAAVTVAVHIAYAAWSAAGVVRGLRLPNCGCFGVFFPRPLGWSTVAEDLAVAGVAAWLWSRARTETPA